MLITVYVFLTIACTLSASKSLGLPDRTARTVDDSKMNVQQVSALVKKSLGLLERAVVPERLPEPVDDSKMNLQRVHELGKRTFGLSDRAALPVDDSKMNLQQVPQLHKGSLGQSDKNARRIDDSKQNMMAVDAFRPDLAEVIQGLPVGPFIVHTTIWPDLIIV